MAKRINPEIDSRIKHGLYYHELYPIWKNMIQRCYNKNHKSYKYYGEKGISVCKRWRISFVNFLEDVGERPKNMQLDRINNDDDYKKSNCHWVTAKQNCNNRNSNTILNYKGESNTVTQWSEKLNIPRRTIHERIKRGCSVSEILKMRLKNDNDAN